ncbi:Protein F32D8.5 b [Aphelenchoides avenae]|nr:Protein F32D8.5 b [Aphelenchus avenae]
MTPRTCFVGLLRMNRSSRLLLMRTSSYLSVSRPTKKLSASTASTSSQNADRFKLVPLKQLSEDDLGYSILHLKENGSGLSQTDLQRRGIRIAKLCSLGSSLAGVVMVPTLTAYLWSAAADRPGMMAFMALANTFLVALTFTPLLLHFLAKRYVANVFYNPRTDTFTTVHYNFILQQRALRFRPEDVVDAAVAPETKKLWLPLATCFVGGKPLLLSLDRQQYRDEAAFDRLTQNVNIPVGAD